MTLRERLQAIGIDHGANSVDEDVAELILTAEILSAFLKESVLCRLLFEIGVSHGQAMREAAEERDRLMVGLMVENEMLESQNARLRGELGKKAD